MLDTAPRRRRLRRSVAAFAAAAAAIGGSIVASPPASAATAIWEGYGDFLLLDTRVGTFDVPDVEAGTMRLRINGTVYAGYCIEYVNDLLSSDVPYVDTTWEAVGATTSMPRVNWILRNSYPLVSTTALAATAGVPSISPAEAAAATQAAIWFFTEPDFGLMPGNPAAVEALYAYLIGPANVGIAAEPPGASLSVTPPAITGGTAGTLMGPFTVSTTAASVTVSVPAPGAVVDASGAPLSSVPAGGSFYVRVPASTPAGTLTVSISGTATIGTGRVFFTPGVEPRLQDQVLAEAAPEPVSATVQVSWLSIITTTTFQTTTTLPPTTAPTTIPTTTLPPFQETTVVTTTTVPPTTSTVPPPPPTSPPVSIQTSVTHPDTGIDEEQLDGMLLASFLLLTTGGAFVGLQLSGGRARRRREG